jgi:hypothetical protein
MGDFLSDLVTKNFGRAAEIQPRLASRFEPIQPVFGLEQTGALETVEDHETDHHFFPRKENPLFSERTPPERPSTRDPFSPENTFSRETPPVTGDSRFQDSEEIGRDSRPDPSPRSDKLPPKTENREANISITVAEVPRGLEEIRQVEANTPPSRLPVEPRPSLDRRPENRRPPLTSNNDTESVRPKVSAALQGSDENSPTPVEFDSTTESESRAPSGKDRDAGDNREQNTVLSPVVVRHRRRNENEGVRAFPERQKMRNGFEEFSAPEPPVINITIGRIEVRAVNSPAPPKETVNRPRATSLEEYLQKRRSGGDR